MSAPKPFQREAVRKCFHVQAAIKDSSRSSAAEVCNLEAVTRSVTRLRSPQALMCGDSPSRRSSLVDNAVFGLKCLLLTVTVIAPARSGPL